MTVHHIINDYNLSLGGAQRLVQDIHLGTLKSGLSSKLFGLSRAPTDELLAAKTLKYDSPYQFGAFIGLWKYCKKEMKPRDVIHAHLFPTIFYVSILKLVRIIPKCKLVVTEHSTSNNRRGKWYGKLIDRITYRSYSQIIAISKGTANSILETLPFLSKKVKVINNGGHLFFKKPINRCSKKKLIILSVGRLHKSKNYETAIKSIVPIKHLNFEYWITGLGKLEKELKAQVENLDLQNKVKFLGYVKDIPALLNESDIFLIPSAWEGFGLAAVEAMNASLPCILANVPGLGDLIEKDGEDAFLVAPSDESLITKKLAFLIENRHIRIQMGKKAFVRSLSFGIDTMTEHYIKLYKEITNEKMA